MKTISRYFCFLVILFIASTSFTSCQKHPPTVKTVSAVANTSTAIAAAGQVTDDGDADVFSYGICLSTNSLPTISDTKKECSSTYSNSPSNFKAVFNDLGMNTTYYLRAYAINSEGIAYGEAISVKMSAAPNVKNVSVSLIKMTEATLNATINPNNTNSENWFEYGILGQTTKKVLAASLTGSSDALVNVKVNDLVPGKTYSFVAKSKNESGETSSDVVTFETFAVSDYDGNLYHTVTIGTQTWLRENLKATHYLNGDPIPNVTSLAAWGSLTTGAYTYYDNDPKIGEVYGALYNWYVGADPRGLVAGYHTPIDLEFLALAIFLDENDNSPSSNLSGLMMMEDGDSHWDSHWYTNLVATNASGFTALPNGNINTSPQAGGISQAGCVFMGLQKVATSWGSSSDGDLGYSVYIESPSCGFYYNGYVGKREGYGLRLLKNN